MADVVVIGGGILGACAAYHLAEAGVRDVVLLEREPALGTQTTAAGAGFVGYWAGELEAQFAAYGMAFYESLQRAEGIDLGVRQSGLLFPALSPAGVEMLRQEYARELTFAPNVQMVDADEACRLSPILDRTSVFGGLFQPDAYQVDTVRVISALGRHLKKHGVDVRLGVEARRVTIERDVVSSVETATETTPARVVINAAGAGTRVLAKRNGIDVAAIPLLESRYVTEPLVGVTARQPMMLFFERNLFYLREEQGGLLIGAIERELGDASRVPLDRPPRTNALSSHATEEHERTASELSEIIPVLRNARVRSRASGLPTWTPDGRHILGRAPGIDGYIVLAGCNETGVTHGPGLGKLAAELATRGTTEADISAYCVDRFHALTEMAMQHSAEEQYLARHPTEAGQAPTPFGITL